MHHKCLARVALGVQSAMKMYMRVVYLGNTHGINNNWELSGVQDPTGRGVATTVATWCSSREVGWLPRASTPQPVTGCGFFSGKGTVSEDSPRTDSIASLSI